MDVAKLYSDAVLPTRKHPTDVGLDLYARIENEYGRGVTAVQPGTFSIIHTGIVIKIPNGFFGWITNKSKNNFLIGGGIVDQDYQGEILVKIINPNNYTEYIYHGDAIAQLIILPAIIPDIEEADLQEIFKEKTERGADGGIGRQLGYLNSVDFSEFQDSYNYAQDDFNFDADRERRMFGKW